MELLMTDTLIINLLDEATQLHSEFYALDLPWYVKYSSIEGYQVEALRVQDLLGYLYLGIKDRSGCVLVWAKSDTRDRIHYITRNTRYGRPLPPELELVAIRYIDSIINGVLRDYVYKYGSQYSTLMFSRVLDSFNIGIGEDIRVIEWEEAQRKGTIKSSWLPTDYYREPTLPNRSNPFTGKVSDSGYYAGLVSDDPVEVNAAIIDDLTAH